VSAELVDARTRESLWRQQYERELAGVLAVHRDIAQQIAQALEPNLTEAQRARLAKQPTDNLEAYTLFLRSRELPSTDRRRNLEAIGLLKDALALDPKVCRGPGARGLSPRLHGVLRRPVLD
jgi:adenylate cyclase